MKEKGNDNEIMDKRALLDTKNDDGASIRFMLNRIKVSFDMKYTIKRKSDSIKTDSMKNADLLIEKNHKMQEIIESIKNRDESVFKKYSDKSRTLTMRSYLSHIKKHRINNHSSELSWEYLIDRSYLLQMETDVLKIE